MPGTDVPEERKKLLKVSFIIPVLNASRHLGTCLKSIRAQAYPQEHVEVIAADGGSTDDTVEIAKSYGAVVVQNPNKLAEYGLQVGIAHATGDLIVIFAADNELASGGWLQTAADAFTQDAGCSALWGPLKSGASDPPVNRYFELIQSDPMTYFMNKNMKYYLNDGKTEYKNGRFIFRVDPKRPLAWGANGLTLRRDLIVHIWAQKGYLGDNDAFQRMVEQGNGKVAYIPELITYHHHVGTVRDFVRKWRRNYVAHFLGNIETRNTNWVFVDNFKAKLILWLLYSTNPFVSGAHALYMAVRDRNPYWAYHPLLCLLQTSVYAYFTLATPKGRSTILRIAKGNKAVPA